MSSRGHTCPPAARDQQVITLQLQREETRKDRVSPTAHCARLGAAAANVAPDRDRASPSRRVVSVPGGGQGWGELPLAPFVPLWVLNHMNVLPSQKNK